MEIQVAIKFQTPEQRGFFKASLIAEDIGDFEDKGLREIVLDADPYDLLLSDSFEECMVAFDEYFDAPDPVSTVKITLWSDEERGWVRAKLDDTEWDDFKTGADHTLSCEIDLGDLDDLGSELADIEEEIQHHSF